MADLQKSQAEWTQFLGRELGTLLSCLYELAELEAKYSRARLRVAVLNDPLGNVGPGGVLLTGVDLGRNTSVGGVLVARVVGAQDPRRLVLSRAPGGQPQDRVAEGAGPAGSLIALGPLNGSGLSGTWDLPPGATEDVSDRLRLAPIPDWPLRAATVWAGPTQGEARAREEVLAAFRAVASRLRDARLVLREVLSALTTRLGSRGAEFLGTVSGALVAEAPTRDPSGAVGRRRAGFLPSLERAMAEETLAGPQAVAPRLVQASPGVFAQTNDGQGRVKAHLPRQSCPAAKWVFRCVRGKDTGHGGREEFECTATLARGERQIAFGGVRVKQSFAGPEGIGPFVLERLPTKTGDPQDALLAAVDALTVAGERDDTTEGGILYWRLEKLGPTFDVAFFKSANRTPGELVAKAEGVAVGAAFQATERTASGLDLTWRLGPQPLHGAEGALDLNFFVTENAQGVPDEFTILTEVHQEGLYQRVLADELGGELSATPQGPVTVPDGWILAGTFLPLTQERS